MWNRKLKVFVSLQQVLLGALFILWGGLAQAETMLVEKKRFTTADFTTVNGKVIKQVDVGWESYGTLNKDKSNVILITHFFSGTSHAAGKYAETDPVAGYWDAIIGPGKAIDTNKYFVISSDTLVNANIHLPNVITTGPASINPDTGKPYALDFPVVTIRDFVNVQKRLLDSLGIKKLHAVVGASMGSFQALEWSVAYPDMVERMASVIGFGKMDQWTIAMLEHWAVPIRLDPNWNNGNYYSGKPPLQGLSQTASLIAQTAMEPRGFNFSTKQFPVWDKAPRQDIRNSFQMIDWLKARGDKRAAMQDANHVLYLIRASQLFMAGHNGDFEASMKKITAKTLFLPASGDLLLSPKLAKAAHDLRVKQGGKSQYDEIPGIWGHLDGIFSISQKADVLSKFLNDE